MKKILLSICIVGLAVVTFAQKPVPQPEWTDFAKNMAAGKQEKITMVYVYNTPCENCMVFEDEIFPDSTVIKALKNDFIATRFFAATKDDIEYKGTNYSYSSFSDDEGVHILAVLLLNGRMGYPSLVFLDKNNDVLNVHYAPQTSREVLTILDYYSSGDYEKTEFDEWIKDKK